MSSQKLNSVLELNCGTGEDAIWFAERGIRVLATDQSSKMIEVCDQKSKIRELDHRISTLQLDMADLGKLKKDNKSFDLIFSNFGGINCLNPESLPQLARDISDLLKPGGRFIGVIMPDICLWESLYFLAKLKGKKAFRRMSKEGVLADLGGVQIKTWYYSPKEYFSFFKKHFKQHHKQPVGFLVPPSYLDPFMARRHRSLNSLVRGEMRIKRFPFLAGLSDHYLMDLVKK